VKAADLDRDDPRRDLGSAHAAALVVHAKALADGIEIVLPRWVIGSVERVYRRWSNRPPPPTVAAAAVRAAELARQEVGTEVRALLEADIDAQRSTPLALLRAAVRYPTGVLVAAGVDPVARDDYQQAAFPEDRYGLTPASLTDLDPALHELGLAWGAAKASVHRDRHAPR
jgi:hypothetical protein